MKKSKIKKVLGTISIIIFQLFMYYVGITVAYDNGYEAAKKIFYQKPVKGIFGTKYEEL